MYVLRMPNGPARDLFQLLQERQIPSRLGRGRDASFVQVNVPIADDQSWLSELLEHYQLVQLGSGSHGEFPQACVIWTARQVPSKPYLLLTDESFQYEQELLQQLELLWNVVQGLGFKEILVTKSPLWCSEVPTDRFVVGLGWRAFDGSCYRESVSFAGVKFFDNEELPKWCYEQSCPIFDANFVVGAELVLQSQLNVFFNLSSQQNLPAFEFVISEACALLQLGDSAQDQQTSKYSENELRKLKGLAEAELLPKVKMLREEQAKAQDKIEQLQKKLVYWFQQQKLLEEQELAQRVLLDRLKALIEKEFRQILSIPKVKNLKVEAGRLKVYTHELIAYDTRKAVYHLLGEFEISICLAGNSSSSELIVYKNLSESLPKSSGMDIQGPHLSVDGVPCLGNYEQSLIPAIEVGNYCLAVVLAIRLVEKPNVSDPWGSRLYRFPTVAVRELGGFYFKA